MGVLTPLVVLSGVVFAVLFALVNIEHPFIAERFVHFAASQWQTGVFCFELIEDNNAVRAYGIGVEPGSSIPKNECDNVMQVYDKDQFYVHLAKGGSTIGLGEAYFNNFWGVDASTQDLGDMLTHLFINTKKTKVGAFQIIKWYLSIYEWQLWMERMSLTKDKSSDMKHVSEHYFDSSFFEAMLDDTMTYTCGMWNKDTKTLRDATINKIEVLLKKLQIEPFESTDDAVAKESSPDMPQVLDIGCGWGFLGSYIANKTNANVTGITISPEQYDYAVQRFGHLPRTHYRLFDFRDVVADYGPGYFDRVISVGVISHIHIKRLGAWMETAYEALKPGGLFVMQGIVATPAWRNDITESAWVNRKKACQGYNYMSKYIFPGGCLLQSDWVYEDALKAGFISMHRELFGQHYSRTLRAWRDNLVANKSIIPERHSGQIFRAFEMYLGQCEAGYRVGMIDKAHWVFYKPLEAEQNNVIHTKKFNAYSNDINLVWQ